MNLIQEVEALGTKFEGEAKAIIGNLVAKLHGDKAMMISVVEAEVAKGSAELQAAWATLKALL